MLHPLHAILSLLILNLTTLVSSASKPTSFCKCVCGANSTIIPLDAPSSSSLNTRSAPTNPFLWPQFQELQTREDEESPEDKGEEEGKGPDPERPDSNKSKDEGKEKSDDGAKAGDNDKAEQKPEKGKQSRRKTCNDCNKQYCLNQHLHICEEVKEAEVFATCFQRDSRKDEAVVFIFIFATAGLLGWAAVKPWVSKWMSGRIAYLPVRGEERDT